MTPTDTPDTTIGNIIIPRFKSISSPFPFFKGWCFLAVKIYLMTLLRVILIFDIAIAFFASKLKNPYEVGTIVPPPPIPAIFTVVKTAIVAIIPQNSFYFKGNKFLCKQIPDSS